MELPSKAELQVDTLGPARLVSPLIAQEPRFVEETQRVALLSDAAALEHQFGQGRTPASFELAGPRRNIFFDPARVTAGVVTCGGLCPGLNDVIRSLALSLMKMYRVNRILGFKYGYWGLAEDSPFEPVELTENLVKDIHEQSGTILGSSRGPQDVAGMVRMLERHQVNMLFTIGGDGTLSGMAALAAEIKRRGLPIAVIGVPKTIDNDLSWTERSFGFSTAVEEAKRAIVAAHAEARSVYHGVGLVKLMGRYSGFIAAHVALATGVVNFCLVPEVPFALAGPNGLLAALERRLERKIHAVIAVAEGAGQEYQEDTGKTFDASGNVQLKDIGLFLLRQIEDHFKARGNPVRIKYIDPSYIIRSQQANSVDSEFCLMLGQHAVHAAMAGRTNMVVGLWNSHFVNIPTAVAIGQRKQLDREGEIWQAVLSATHQRDMLAN
jgi:6-phosphofructokinase 1